MKKKLENCLKSVDKIPENSLNEDLLESEKEDFENFFIEIFNKFSNNKKNKE